MSPTAEAEGTEVGPVRLHDNACIVSEATNIAKLGENGTGGGVQPSELINPEVVKGAQARDGKIAHRARRKGDEGGRTPSIAGNTPVDLDRAPNEIDAALEKSVPKGKVFLVEEAKKIANSVRERVNRCEDIECRLSSPEEGTKGKPEDFGRVRRREQVVGRDSPEKGSRGRRLADTDTSPRVAGPDGVSASGVRKMTEREMDMPEISRTTVLRGPTDEDSPLPRGGRGRQREEKLAKPNVRNNEESIASHHATEIWVI
jgi:hypothetical protein